MFRRKRFAEVIDTQLDLFTRDNRDVIDEVAQRLKAYDRAGREQAEELYGDYIDAVETGTEILADLRDHYARTLEDADAYCIEFNRAVAKRLPTFALEIENR
jgi:isocitrate dehydrogenase kinase/phosphatase